MVSGLCLFSRFHAERAIDIITHILPEDHLLLASSKRVKGMFPGNAGLLPCGGFHSILSGVSFSLSSLRSKAFLFHSPALILEEIAIDCHNKETEERLLQEAHDLHLSSLQLAKKAFGEFNVQTAKHYGNLGRLYQSMRKFKVHILGCLSSPVMIRGFCF